MKLQSDSTIRRRTTEAPTEIAESQGHGARRAPFIILIPATGLRGSAGPPDDSAPQWLVPGAPTVNDAPAAPGAIKMETTEPWEVLHE
jgi:hypothetical protein